MSDPVVAVFAPDAVGHFAPLRPVIAGLAGRGCEVHVYTAGKFAPQVEAAGGRCVDLFARYLPEAADDESIPVPSRYVSFAGHYAEQIVNDLAAIGPSLVVHDSFAVIGRVVGLALGVPYVNAIIGHNLPPQRYLPQLFAEREIRTSERCLRAVEVLRDRYGMADASPFSYVTGLSPHLNLLFEPPEWLPEADRAPYEPVAFFGSVAPDVPRGPSGFRGDGGLKVHVSLGTVTWWYWPDLAMDALDAIARGVPDRADVVMSLSGGPAAPQRVEALRRAGMRVEHYADTWGALAEADVVVTAHGANTTHEAVFSRVPMLGYPFHGDQPELAELCEGLGVALRLVKEPRAPLTPEAVADGLTQIAQRRADFDAALERARGWELDVIARRGEVIERMLALAQA
jgi:UDP:flavonoid glycosyltransferase YjiC (YdhE family)